jgi:hypothetical protein
MKHFLFTVCCNLLVLIAAAQLKVNQPDPSKKILIVETACGECRLGLHGKSCDLAVRIDGKAYFVDGAHIDSFGDAHAKDGFCQAIRKAEVQGAIEGDRFKVTYLKLLPAGKKNAGKPAAFHYKGTTQDFYTAKPGCLQCLFL